MCMKKIVLKEGAEVLAEFKTWLDAKGTDKERHKFLLLCSTYTRQELQNIVESDLEKRRALAAKKKRMTRLKDKKTAEDEETEKEPSDDDDETSQDEDAMTKGEGKEDNDDNEGDKNDTKGDNKKGDVDSCTTKKVGVSNKVTKHLVTKGSHVVEPTTAFPKSTDVAMDGDLLMKSITVALRGPIPPIVETKMGPSKQHSSDC